MVNEKIKDNFCCLRDKIIEMQYKKLNNEQRQSVLSSDGPLLILAGAGSGKTTVLVNRIANLINFGNVYKTSNVPEDICSEDTDIMEKWLSGSEGQNSNASKIAHLIKYSTVYPSQILAITFTNKAAQEMKDRVRILVGEEARNMWISTFHSCCVRILRREIDKLGYNKNFAIYDSYDQKTLIKQCMQELNINDKEITDKEILNKIGHQKDNLVSEKQYKQISEKDFRLNKIADVYLLYQKKLKNSNALDFDDIIFKTVELFKKDRDVLEFYQRKFKYIMVDEYQDTNRAQYELVRLLAASHKNICVVGDDDQSIYGWRGADIRNILDFEKDYPNAKVIKLEQNYRSKGNILKAANDVIKNNTERKSKILRTESEDGDKIHLYNAPSDLDEGNFVASEIKKIMKEDNKNYKDFAILYRTNAQSRIFEDVFIRRGVPYRIIGGLKFYDRKEIKDIISYLKLINNPLDDVSLKRVINVPKRSIGDATVDKIQGYSNYMDQCLYSTLLDIDNVTSLTARNISSINKFTSLINSFIRIKDEIPVSKLIEEVLNQTGYIKELELSQEIENMTRIENLRELVSAAVDFENGSEDKSLSAFLENVTLVSDIDNFDENEDTVVMMTVHSAKGLEFPVVFMVGMENGLFPGTQSLIDFKEMEESRRLCYVGITRAKEKLYMTCAAERKIFGRTVYYAMSDFINEISPDLRENVSINMKHDGPEGIRDGMENRRSFFQAKRSSYLDNNYEMANHRAVSKMSSHNEEIAADSSLRAPERGEFKQGSRVRHPKFGIGTIISVLKDGNNVKLTIAFENMGIKQLMADVAPLKLL